MKNMKNFTISYEASIEEAIAALNSNGSQIVFVVKDKRVLGTVTDGDIRRAILKRLKLDSSVNKIMNKNFLFLLGNATEKEALLLMQKNTVRHVPLLDQEKKLKNIFFLENLVNPKNLLNDVIIMAGGEGKRLGNLTKNCPKPMLKINNKPILEIILEQCIDSGLKNFYFSVRYLKEKIKNYFQDGSRWNVNISYIEEVKPLGTAGCLSLLNQKLKQPFFVLNGDVLTKVDYKNFIQFHKNNNSNMSICVKEHITQIPYGTIKMNDLQVVAIEEKPIQSYFVNAGIYVLQPNVVSLVPKNTFFEMTDLIKLCMKKKYKINAFAIHEYWQDLGYIDNLKKSNKDWE